MACVYSTDGRASTERFRRCVVGRHEKSARMQAPAGVRGERNGIRPSNCGDWQDPSRWAGGSSFAFLEPLLGSGSTRAWSDASALVRSCVRRARGGERDSESGELPGARGDLSVQVFPTKNSVRARFARWGAIDIIEAPAHRERDPTGRDRDPPRSATLIEIGVRTARAASSGSPGVESSPSRPMEHPRPLATRPAPEPSRRRLPSRVGPFPTRNPIRNSSSEAPSVPEGSHLRSRP